MPELHSFSYNIAKGLEQKLNTEIMPTRLSSKVLDRLVAQLSNNVLKSVEDLARDPEACALLQKNVKVMKCFPGLTTPPVTEKVKSAAGPLFSPTETKSQKEVRVAGEIIDVRQELYERAMKKAADITEDYKAMGNEARKIMLKDLEDLCINKGTSLNEILRNPEAAMLLQKSTTIQFALSQLVAAPPETKSQNRYEVAMSLLNEYHRYQREYLTLSHEGIDGLVANISKGEFKSVADLAMDPRALKVLQEDESLKFWCPELKTPGAIDKEIPAAKTPRSPTQQAVAARQREEVSVAPKITSPAAVVQPKTPQQLTQVQKSIEEFVQGFLHPYITGQITRENEPPDRKSMMELLMNKLNETYPTETLDEKWIEEIAYKEYLKEAIRGFSVTPGPFNKKAITQSYVLMEALMKGDKSVRSQLIQALMEAIPKDFPSKRQEPPESIEKALSQALNDFKIQRDKNEAEIDDYRLRQGRRPPLNFHKILYPSLERHWEAKKVLRYTPQDLQQLGIVEEIENASNQLINDVLHTTSAPKTMKEIERLPSFVQLTAVLDKHKISQKQRNEIMEAIRDQCIPKAKE